jgi:hypothetical protein
MIGYSQVIPMGEYGQLSGLILMYSWYRSMHSLGRKWRSDDWFKSITTDAESSNTGKPWRKGRRGGTRSLVIQTRRLSTFLVLRSMVGQQQVLECAVMVDGYTVGHERKSLNQPRKIRAEELEATSRPSAKTKTPGLVSPCLPCTRSSLSW